jgi:hypothetical protein
VQSADSSSQAAQFIPHVPQVLLLGPLQYSLGPLQTGLQNGAAVPSLGIIEKLIKQLVQSPIISEHLEQLLVTVEQLMQLFNVFPLQC